MSSESVSAGPTAAAATARPAAAADKMRVFVIVFSIAASLVYVLSEILHLTLFTYHPATGRLEWGHAPPRRGEGPVMYWYGWVATTLLLSTFAGLAGTLLPDRITRRIPLFLLWLLPVLAVPVMAWTLMAFWTK